MEFSLSKFESWVSIFCYTTTSVRQGLKSTTAYKKRWNSLMELCIVPEKSSAFKSWISYEATVRVTFKGKCILNEFGQGFPSEFEFFCRRHCARVSHLSMF